MPISFDTFQEWKERKKFQRHLIAAKKKLCEMEQQHVFHGFRFGEKSHTRLLAEQIVGVNSKLLQQALQYIEKPSKRWFLIISEYLLWSSVDCETLILWSHFLCKNFLQPLWYYKIYQHKLINWIDHAANFLLLCEVGYQFFLISLLF